MFDSVKKECANAMAGEPFCGSREVVSLEIAQGHAAGVVVELLQQQDVGPHALDDLRHGALPAHSPGVARSRRSAPSLPRLRLQLKVAMRIRPGGRSAAAAGSRAHRREDQ